MLKPFGLFLIAAGLIGFGVAIYSGDWRWLITTGIVYLLVRPI